MLAMIAAQSAQIADTAVLKAYTADPCAIPRPIGKLITIDHAETAEEISMPLHPTLAFGKLTLTRLVFTRGWRYEKLPNSSDT